MQTTEPGRHDAYLLRLSDEERKALNRVVKHWEKPIADTLRSLISKEDERIKHLGEKKR
jgi:hypothetical protein